jgi:hypothetical protein
MMARTSSSRSPERAAVRSICSDFRAIHDQHAGDAVQVRPRLEEERHRPTTA